MTRRSLERRWNGLFDEHPWLEGMTASGGCDDAFCCPSYQDADWLVLAEVHELLFLATGATRAGVLHRGLLAAGGASEDRDGALS